MIESKSDAKKIEITLPDEHDFVHDIAFNHFSDRLALCTSSRQIFVYDQVGTEWKNSGIIITGHSGPIWRLDWAHPEYGAVLVSCSEDRGVLVWTEKPRGKENTVIIPFQENDKDNEDLQSRWRKRAQLLDATAPATCVKFAPKQHGLKIAVTSLDGVMRIYEATDVLNMTVFELEAEITVSASSKSGKYQGLQSLSWGTSVRKGGHYIAVLGVDSSLTIFQKNQSRRWNNICKAEHGAPGQSKDLCFAPYLCRPHDILVTCGKPQAIIWRLDLLKGSSQLSKIKTLSSTGDSMVWRVAWNFTGTLLTLSPEHGPLEVWTADSKGEWQNVCQVEDAN